MVAKANALLAVGFSLEGGSEAYEAADFYDCGMTIEKVVRWVAQTWRGLPCLRYARRSHHTTMSAPVLGSADFVPFEVCGFYAFRRQN
jgi:hypothetical protein